MYLDDVRFSDPWNTLQKSQVQKAGKDPLVFPSVQ